MDISRPCRIVRWNDDRAAAALQQRASSLRSYSNTLRFAVNELYEKVLGTHNEDSERLALFHICFMIYWYVFQMLPEFSEKIYVHIIL